MLVAAVAVGLLVSVAVVEFARKLACPLVVAVVVEAVDFA